MPKHQTNDLLHSRLLCAMIVMLIMTACAATHDAGYTKIKGVNLEAPSARSTDNVMVDLSNLGANYVSLIPYSFVKDGDTEVMYDHSEWQWWGEQSEGVEVMTREAHEAGLSVMLKPHMWIGHGTYTGELTFDSVEKTKDWQSSYKKYIIHHAELAEANDISILCLGTELCEQVALDPIYWSTLITDIRKVYSGKLTYAANWDCFTKFPHWNLLDFVGIDAYFPLEYDSKDSLKDLIETWQPWKHNLASFSDSVRRPILFTEYGYRSTSEALKRPWDNHEPAEQDLEQQRLGYEALYKAVWSEPWMSGGFLWKWHCKEHIVGKNRNTDFTPQDKPSLEVIRRVYRAQPLIKEEK